jgi:hypothetical protein
MDVGRKKSQQYPEGHSIRYWKRNPDKLALALAEEAKKESRANAAITAERTGKDEKAKKFGRPKFLDYTIFRLSVPLPIVGLGVTLNVYHSVVLGPRYLPALCRPNVVRCSCVAFLAALVKVDKNAYGCAAPCPYPFFDPPQAAKVITLDASFQTLGRKHTERIVKQQ